MTALYWICPRCGTIEITSDYCSGVTHNHDLMLFILRVFPSRKEAEEELEKWKKGRLQS